MNRAEQMFSPWVLPVHTSFSHGADPAHGGMDAHILTWSLLATQSDGHISVPDIRDICRALVHEINSIVNGLYGLWRQRPWMQSNTISVKSGQDPVCNSGKHPVSRSDVLLAFSTLPLSTHQHSLHTSLGEQGCSEISVGPLLFLVRYVVVNLSFIKCCLAYQSLGASPWIHYLGAND